MPSWTFSKRILGLDIGRHAVYGVEVVARNRKIESVLCHSEPIMASADLPPESALVQALGSLKKKIERPDLLAEVVAAVPPYRVFHKSIDVPFRDRRKIEKVLPTELESHIPFDVESVVFDFNVIGKQAKGGRVFVAGARKDPLKMQLQLLKDAGLEPQRLQSSLVGLAHVARRGVAEGSSRAAILHIADHHAAIGILEGGSLKTAHSLLLSHNGTMEASLVRHMRQVVSHYQSESADSIGRVFLSGDLATDDPLVERLRRELNLKVEPLGTPPPITPARIPPADRPRFMVALGCALSVADGSPWGRLNLRQGELEFRRPLDAWKQQWKIPAVLGIVLAVGALADFGFSLASRIRESKSIQGRIRDEYVRLLPDASGNPKGRELADLKTRVKAMNAEAAFLTSGVQNAPTAFEVLVEISRLLPPESLATIYALKIEEGRSSLEGRAGSFSGAEAAYKALSQSKLLRNVELPITRGVPKSDEVQFTIRFELVSARPVEKGK